MKFFFSYLITYTFFLFIIHQSKCQYSSFGLDLDAYQERCVIEYYKKETVIIFQATSKSKDILIQIKEMNDNIIYHNTNFTSVFSFTSKYNGYYNFCMKNNGNGNADIDIEIKSGISANDYSSVAKSKDLEPIDYTLNKIMEKEYRLNHFNKITQENQNIFGILYKTISSKIIFYSFLLIIGMVLIGFIETLYLKRFMERRKII